MKWIAGAVVVELIVNELQDDDSSTDPKDGEGIIVSPPFLSLST
jgi:hypothetical protein